MLIYVALTGSQTSGQSLTMEMAQDGFSAAYVPGVIKFTRNSLDNIVLKTKTHTLSLFVAEKQTVSYTII